MEFLVVHGKMASKVEEAENSCPECGCAVLVTDAASGEVVCANCGLVIQERGVDRSEERGGTDDDGKSRGRTGAPLTLMFPDYGLSATIGSINADYEGRPLPIEVSRSMRRLKWYEKTTMPDDRAVNKAAYVIDLLADKLNLPRPVAETAMSIFRRAQKAGLLFGRPSAHIAVAATYAACRIAGVPVNFDEIEKAYPMVRKITAARMYRKLVRKLGLKVPRVDMRDYVWKVATKVGLDERVVNEALRILETASNDVITGKHPGALVAAAIVVACGRLGIRVARKRVARAAGVTDASTRSRIRDLEGVLACTTASP
ncbi:MAG: TFIIB-type zinc ribbon-containing protein [Nitrososphaerota archaeon]